MTLNTYISRRFALNAAGKTHKKEALKKVVAWQKSSKLNSKRKKRNHVRTRQTLYLGPKSNTAHHVRFFCSSVRPLLLLTFLCGMGRTMHFVKETFLCEFLSESINLMPYYRWQLLLSFQNSVKEYNPNFLLIIAFLWIWHHVQSVCPTFISLVIPYIMKPESAMVWEIIEYPICIRSVAFRKERKKFFLVCNNSPYSFCGTFSLHSHTHKDTYPSWNVVFGMYFALLLLYSHMSHEKQQLWRKMLLEWKTNNYDFFQSG